MTNRATDAIKACSRLHSQHEIQKANNAKTPTKLHNLYKGVRASAQIFLRVHSRRYSVGIENKEVLWK